MVIGNKENPKEQGDDVRPVPNNAPKTADGKDNPAAKEGLNKGSKDNDMAAQLEEAQHLANEHWEKLLRAQAEVENIRKRSARDIEQARVYGIERFAVEMLAVKDSLELGLAGDEQSPEKMKEGTELTLKLLEQIFERFGIEEISPQGDKFDPEKHQAMSIQQNNEYATGTVFEVLQKGYALNERLIRPAMVNVVGTPPEPKTSEGNPQETKEIGG